MSAAAEQDEKRIKEKEKEKKSNLKVVKFSDIAQKQIYDSSTLIPIDAWITHKDPLVIAASLPKEFLPPFPVRFGPLRSFPAPVIPRNKKMEEWFLLRHHDIMKQDEDPNLDRYLIAVSVDSARGILAAREEKKVVQFLLFEVDDGCECTPKPIANHVNNGVLRADVRQDYYPDQEDSAVPRENCPHHLRPAADANRICGVGVLLNAALAETEKNQTFLVMHIRCQFRIPIASSHLDCVKYPEEVVRVSAEEVDEALETMHDEQCNIIATEICQHVQEFVQSRYFPVPEGQRIQPAPLGCKQVYPPTTIPPPSRIGVPSRAVTLLQEKMLALALPSWDDPIEHCAKVGESITHAQAPAFFAARRMKMYFPPPAPVALRLPPPSVPLSPRSRSPSSS